jgi:hypothetical protein
VQIHGAKLGKKHGPRAQISRVGHKLLYGIHPWCHEMFKKLIAQAFRLNYKPGASPTVLEKDLQKML